MSKVFASFVEEFTHLPWQMEDLYELYIYSIIQERFVWKHNWLTCKCVVFSPDDNNWLYFCPWMDFMYRRMLLCSLTISVISHPRWHHPRTSNVFSAGEVTTFPDFTLLTQFPICSKKNPIYRMRPGAINDWLWLNGNNLQCSPHNSLTWLHTVMTGLGQLKIPLVNLSALVKI